MTDRLTLISHHLCPYVQRAVIALTEKSAPFERVYVDLSKKPEWFLKASPLGRTPVLKVGERSIFESAVILEYLEETQPKPLHPTDPLERAEHRSWIEFGSAILNDIAGFYNAKDQDAFVQKTNTLEAKFARLEERLVAGPWFGGDIFSLADTVYGPVFRYFDVFDRIADFGVFEGKPKTTLWRQALGDRPSVQTAAPEDYNDRLKAFLVARNSYISTLI